MSTHHDIAPLDANELAPAVHQEVRESRKLLRLLLDLVRPVHFAIAGQGRQIRKIVDWPFPGGVRYIIPYTGLGGQVVLAGATPAQLTAADGGNGIGTEIRNVGTGLVLLYLCDLATYNAVPQPAVPVIGLAPIPATGPGGALSRWDGLISGYVYAGPIVAVSAAGSTITVAAL